MYQQARSSKRAVKTISTIGALANDGLVSAPKEPPKTASGLRYPERR
jgi:hypothetical protein